jgi:hypothetical protein
MEKSKLSIGEYLSRIGLLITAISLSTFAVGCYIINTYLGTFELQDFDLVKPRAVFVGLTFTLLLAMNIGIYFIVPDKMTKNAVDIKGLVRHNVIKFIYVTLCLYLIFEFEFATSEFCKFQFLKWELDFRDNLWYALSLLFLGHLMTHEGKSNWVHASLYWLTITVGTLLILLYMPVIEFILILMLEGIIALFMIRFHTRTGELVNKKIGEIEMESMLGDDDEQNESQEHPSEERIRVYLKRFKNYYSKFENLGFGFLAVGGFAAIAAIYSYNFYERIPQSFGGGKLHPIIYVCGVDTVKGKKIYETENYVFVQLKDKSIRKLDWKDITKILNQTNK